MINYEQIHEEIREGFKIAFSVTYEDQAPDWDNDTEEQRLELLADIDSGRLQWFTAKVSAYKNGIKLSDDWLGGCCYKEYMDFVNDDYYYADMVNTVIKEAKEAIKQLQEN